MLAGILSGLASFALFMAAHVVAFHVNRDQDRSKTIVRLFSAAVLLHVATVTFAAALAPGLLSALGSGVVLSQSVGLLLMACLFVLYMPFYYTLNTSLSVETLAMLAAKGGGRLPVQDVRHRFTSDRFLLDRLETMCRNGYLQRKEGGAYALLPRGRRIAGLMLKVKDTLKLGPGG